MDRFQKVASEILDRVRGFRGDDEGWKLAKQTVGIHLDNLGIWNRSHISTRLVVAAAVVVLVGATVFKKQPPDAGKTIIFRAKAKFFGQKQAAKNEKKNIFCIY